MHRRTAAHVSKQRQRVPHQARRRHRLGRVARPSRWSISPISWRSRRIATAIRCRRAAELGGRAHAARRADAQGRRADRRDRIYRQEVRPFTDKQIELVHELRRPGRHRHREHAAAQRAAPAHRRSHRVAGAADRDHRGAARSSRSSPGELEPVFEAMLENATRICEAKFGTLYPLRGRTLPDRRRASACRRRMPSCSRSPRLRPRTGPSVWRVAATRKTCRTSPTIVRTSLPRPRSFGVAGVELAASDACWSCRCSRTTS